MKSFWKINHGNFRKNSRISDEGIFKFHTLSYIHSPDDNKEKILRELNILQKLRILSNNNEISKQELDIMKKYKTYDVIECREIEKDME